MGHYCQGRQKTTVSVAQRTLARALVAEKVLQEKPSCAAEMPVLGLEP